MKFDTIQDNTFDVFRSFSIKHRFMNHDQCTWVNSKLDMELNNIEYDATTFIEIPRDDSFGGLYDDIQGEVEDLNTRFNQFEISAFVPLKYCVYVPGSSTDLHIDFNPNYAKTKSQVKLSIIIPLNNDFTGGSFEFYSGQGDRQSIPPLEAGDLILLSSFIPYKMTKVESGLRKFLHGAVLGPPFR